MYLVHWILLHAGVNQTELFVAMPQRAQQIRQNIFDTLFL